MYRAPTWRKTDPSAPLGMTEKGGRRSRSRVGSHVSRLLRDRGGSARPFQHGAWGAGFYAHVTHTEDARRIRAPGPPAARGVAYFLAIEREGGGPIGYPVAGAGKAG